MQITERVIVGAAGSLMTVRQLTLCASNFEIGHTIGELAITRYGQTAARYAAEPLYARARRAYFQRHYPIHWERMRGVAAAFGVDPEDDRYDLSALMYHMDLPPGLPGCSAVYYPPAATATGGGYLSRNYDFSTGSLADLLRLPLPPEARAQLPAIMAEPYVMQWYPEDGGYASLAIQGCDLLSGTFDGINSAGLVVAILADDEGIARLGPDLERHPGPARAVGLHELQVMRLLLDTCATADEARAALLAVKDFYAFAPLRYLVADRSGDSFVYEHSTGRNAQYVHAGDGRPQMVSNFEIYRHPAGDPVFDAAFSRETNAFWRYRRLSDLIDAHPGPFTPDDMTAINGAVNYGTIFGGELEPRFGRTLWHSLYDQAAGTAVFHFYLGDTIDPDGRYSERRTDHVKLALTTDPQRSEGGYAGPARPALGGEGG